MEVPVTELSSPFVRWRVVRWQQGTLDVYEVLVPTIELVLVEDFGYFVPE